MWISTQFPKSWIRIWQKMIQHFYFIYRFLGGMGLGFELAVATVYIVEIASTDMRGVLGCFVQFMGSIGVLFTFVAGTFLNWYFYYFFEKNFKISLNFSKILGTGWPWSTGSPWSSSSWACSTFLKALVGLSLKAVNSQPHRVWNGLGTIHILRNHF